MVSKKETLCRANGYKIVDFTIVCIKNNEKFNIKQFVIILKNFYINRYTESLVVTRLYCRHSTHYNIKL